MSAECPQPRNLRAATVGSFQQEICTPVIEPNACLIQSAGLLSHRCGVPQITVASMRPETLLPGFVGDISLAQIDLRRAFVIADAARRPANRADPRARQGLAGRVQQGGKRSRGRLRVSSSRPRRLWPETARLAGLPASGDQFGPVILHQENPEEPQKPK